MKKAFTLIELFVVICILLILAAIMVPVWVQVSNKRYHLKPGSTINKVTATSGVVR